MPLPNPGQDAVPFTTLTAQFYDETIENIEALADGSGLDDGAVTADKIDIPYDTTEQLTGSTWHDGKPIYRRVVTGLTATTGTTVNANHGISIETPIKAHGLTASSTTIPLYFNSTTFISIRLNLTQISVSLGSGVASTTVDAVIEYTKT